MLGVSTEQNTTNLIPALQEGVTDFVMIETSKANAEQWSKGIQKVFKKNNIHFDKIVLQKEEDSRIDYIMHYLYDYIAKNIKEEDTVIWNLGGGQKPQQLAIWTIFTNEQKSNYQSCYTNPVTKLTEWWVFDDESRLIFDFKPTICKASLLDVIEVFGLEFKERPDLIYKNNQKITLAPITDWFHVQEVRKYLYSLPLINVDSPNDTQKTITELLTDIEANKRNIVIEIKNDERFNQHLQNLRNYDASINGLTNSFLQLIKKTLNSAKIIEDIEIKNEELKKNINSSTLKVNYDFITQITPSLQKHNAAFYFEAILIRRIKEILESENQDIFVEAYANLKTYTGNEMKAEYDIILLTKWGTLIAVDAKTFAVNKKDIDARIHNLEKAGGRFVKFLLVFPYHPKDIETMIEIPDAIKKLPNICDNRRIPYFVIADGEQNSFFIDKVTLKKVNKKSHNTLELKTLSNFLNYKF